MVCRIDIDGLAGVVLVSHSPISVFSTTSDHLDSIPRKSDGHYNREDVVSLVDQGKAVHYDEDAVRAISTAMNFIIFGCPRF